GSHFANYREAWEANRLIAKGLIHPTLSRAYPLAETGQAAYDVHRNLHQGKVGVLCLAPEEGLGVRDPELRAAHATAINRFRNVCQGFAPAEQIMFEHRSDKRDAGSQVRHTWAPGEPAGTRPDSARSSFAGAHRIGDMNHEQHTELLPLGDIVNQ